MRNHSKLMALCAVLPLLVVAACGSDSPNGGDKVDGGTVTVAQQPGSTPNYIFPLVPPGYNTIANVEQFQQLMYRPLYWVGEGDSIAIDPELSLAEEPEWNDDLDMVTVKLKPSSWSDGSELGPQDVAFWLNLLRANKTEYASYAEGQFPDNLESATYDEDASSFTLKLTDAVSPDWFLYNQLARITPLPAAWDTTGSGDGAGCASTQESSETSDACVAVFKYMNELAQQTGSYDSEPLWQVVNGPFRLESFDAQGAFTMVPNPEYTGSIKPSVDEIRFEPFTDEAAAYNALQTGKLSIGYVSPNLLAAKQPQDEPGRSPVQGFSLDPVQPWGFSYILINFNNPAAGPIFAQDYARQALQRSIDQDTYVEKAANGYGLGSWGPVPVEPPSAFTAAMSKDNPYPFDLDAARALLEDNGWEVPDSGPAVCASAGSGTGQCGEGISGGSTFSLDLVSFSGVPSVSQQMAQFVSDASKAGIEINLKEMPAQQMVAQAVQCESGDPECDWQLINYGSWILASYPSGEALFKTGAGANIGNYSDAEMDALIDRTVYENDVNAIAAYGDYAAQEIPVLWLPTTARPVNAVDDSLDGVSPSNALYRLTPERWAFTE